MGCSFEGYQLEVLLEHNDVTGIFVCQNEGLYYIVKVALNREAASLIEHEQRMITSVRHSGVVSFIEQIDIRGFPALVLRRYTRGSLTRYIGLFSVQERSTIFARLCEICTYLYEKGIYHRDIKPENIVLDDSGMPVLIDFGMSCLVGEQEEYFTGTFDYAAPEVLEDHTGTYESELYSIACVLYTLCHGSPPSKDTFIRTKHGLSSKEDAMLNRMLHPDPSQRREIENENTSEVEIESKSSRAQSHFLLIILFLMFVLLYATTIL